MNDGGSIIITSSVAGVTGDPGVYGYITAKHAQVGLMRVLAKELAGRNIRVNTVHPGPVDNAFQLNVEQKLGAISAATERSFSTRSFRCTATCAPRKWPVRCCFSPPMPRASPPDAC